MSYIEHLFGCQDKNRLYKLLDCLKEFATKIQAMDPTPKYTGDGWFEVRLPLKRKAELQDTNLGITRLIVSGLTETEASLIKKIFSRYWQDNYNVEYQSLSL